MSQLTQEQIGEMMLTLDGKYTLVEKGINLDLLVKDENFRIRLAIVEKGYELDILMYDECPGVRAEVAKRGHKLDVLLNDESWIVKVEVAEHGVGLDVLINDEDSDVVEVCNQLKGVLETIVIDRSFGTYEGNLFLYIFEGKYMIRSGCYVSENLEQWKHTCEAQIDKETAELYSEKMKNILDSYGFKNS